MAGEVGAEPCLMCHELVDDADELPADEDERVGDADGPCADGAALDLDPERAARAAARLMPPPPPMPERALARKRARRCVLMYSPRYARVCARLACTRDRDALTYALLGACGVSRFLRVVEPQRATAGHLARFHTRAYVELLLASGGAAAAAGAAGADEQLLERHGLVDDCEPFCGLGEYCASVAGASLHAASLLLRREADLAINWGGGRHHARRASASGFCYVNDVVLATRHLLKGFNRVLVVDTDVHHGDGVEEAFWFEPRVFVLSLHKKAAGFFPGSGAEEDLSLIHI